MTRVFLVRHGQASAGTSNYDRLSDKGIEQARLLGDHWNQNDFRVDAAFNGSLQRQKHTAELTLAGLDHDGEVETLEALNEYDHHAIDRLYGNGMVTDGGGDLRFDQYVEIMSRWRDAPATNETQCWQNFSTQGWNAIRAAVDAHANTANKHPDKHANLVFFTSGGVIATVLQQLLSVEFEPTMHALWQIRNTSVTQLLFNRDGACLVDYNTVAHLQMQQDKSLITLI